MPEFQKRNTGLRVLISLLVFSVGCLSPQALAQHYIFGRADVRTGNVPYDVVVADFNGDGKPDLAVTNNADNTVSIILAARDGIFTPKRDYLTGNSPTNLVAADFNNDGKVDLAVINNQDGTVSVLLGNGDGTFRAHVDYTVGNNPVGLVAANFKRDNKVDLAIVNQADNSVSILLGNGDGTFQTQRPSSVGAGPIAVAKGDFNNDGMEDLITANSDAGSASALLSNGDGTFTRMDTLSIASPQSIGALAVGDFERHGKLDIAVTDRQNRNVLFLKGNGDGTFGSPVAVNPGSQFLSNSIAVGDFNGDGKLDLLVGGFYVLLGKGNGTFRPPLSSPFLAFTSSLAVADINGDGRLDLVVPDSVNTIGIVLGNADGTFGSFKSVRLARTIYGTNAGVAADFNGDGYLDLAVAENTFTNGQVSVELGRGDGTFQNPRVSPLSSPISNNQNFMLAADFNGDGFLDLAILDMNSSGYEILLGKGDGTFQPPIDNLVTNLIGIAAGDLNGDGKADLIVVSFDNTGSSFTVYLSNGDGTFAKGATYIAPSYLGVTLADVNQDGKLDVVDANQSGPVLVFLGNGDGTFQSAIVGPSVPANSRPVAGDFNGDGKVDLVIESAGLAFLAGNGDGTFQTPVYSDRIYLYSGSLFAADFNGDGKLDLLSSAPDNSYSGAAIMTGDGRGHFSLPMSYIAVGPTEALIPGDFNSDGISDLALVNGSASSSSAGVLLFLSTSR
jgi:hypothetical protein